MCQRGNALIIVIAILFLLAAVAVSFERMVTLELRTSQNHQGTLQRCAAIAAAQTPVRDAGRAMRRGSDHRDTLPRRKRAGLFLRSRLQHAPA